MCQRVGHAPGLKAGSLKGHANSAFLQPTAPHQTHFIEPSQLLQYACPRKVSCKMPQASQTSHVYSNSQQKHHVRGTVHLRAKELERCHAV